MFATCVSVSNRNYYNICTSSRSSSSVSDCRTKYLFCHQVTGSYVILSTFSYPTRPKLIFSLASCRLHKYDEVSTVSRRPIIHDGPFVVFYFVTNLLFNDLNDVEPKLTDGFSTEHIRISRYVEGLFLGNLLLEAMYYTPISDCSHTCLLPSVDATARFSLR